MADYQNYECQHCGTTFLAHPSAIAAGGYCSPACATTGQNLA